MADEIDVLGYDQGDILGAMARTIARTNPALARRITAQRPAGGGQPSRPQLPTSSVQTNTLLSFLGMAAISGPTVGQPFVRWVGADAADKSMQVEPQESFEGRRMVIDVARSATAAASITFVRTLFVGSQPQSPAVDVGTPTSLFRPDATSADINLQIAYRANKINLSLGISAAPGGTDTVDASAGFYGNWIR